MQVQKPQCMQRWIQPQRNGHAPPCLKTFRVYFGLHNTHKLYYYQHAMFTIYIFFSALTTKA